MTCRLRRCVNAFYLPGSRRKARAALFTVWRRPRGLRVHEGWLTACHSGFSRCGIGTRRVARRCREWLAGADPRLDSQVDKVQQQAGNLSSALRCPRSPPSWHGELQLSAVTGRTARRPQRSAFTGGMKRSANTNKRKLCSVEQQDSGGEEKDAVSSDCQKGL